MAAIYQADMYCDDCAAAIVKSFRGNRRLTRQQAGLLIDGQVGPTNSDIFPVRCGDDEPSDTPTHCAAGPKCKNALKVFTLAPPGDRSNRKWKTVKVGMLFGGLTADGIQYVREHALDPLDAGPVVDLWIRHYERAGYDFELTRCPHCDGAIER